MKGIIHFLCFAILFTACSEKEDIEECIGIIDFFGPPSFQLKFIDGNENDLIENEYYDSDFISASINSLSYDNQIVNFDDQRSVNSVILPSVFGVEGENRWLLKLSENEIDTLDFSLVLKEVKQDGLCGTTSSVEIATYNGNPINLATSYDKESYLYLIQINKTIE